ncbi:MAG: PTS sugar transporter subunit IIC [Thermodesulfobacteriota bacterium]
MLRFSINIGILERPLVQGLVFGLLAGNLELALYVSVIFELFWLDLIPAGTYIPPNTAASNLSCLTLLHAFGFTTPAEAVFPILLCLPLGWIGARLEDFLRARRNAAYDRLQAWARGDAVRPVRLGRTILEGMIQNWVAHFLFFFAAVLALISLVGLLRAWNLLQPPQGLFSWGHLWVAASFGGILSLRSLRAYGSMAAGVVAVLLASLFYVQ